MLSSLRHAIYLESLLSGITPDITSRYLLDITAKYLLNITARYLQNITARYLSPLPLPLKNIMILKCKKKTIRILLFLHIFFLSFLLLVVIVSTMHIFHTQEVQCLPYAGFLRLLLLIWQKLIVEAEAAYYCHWWFIAQPSAGDRNF